MTPENEAEIMPVIEEALGTEPIEPAAPMQDTPEAVSPVESVPTPPPYSLPPITLLSLIIEVGVIWLALTLFTHTYQNFDPTLRPNGGDWMYLLSSGGYAAKIFRQSGAIPLWNPFIGTGEPMIEGVLSFVLNPFMFLPIVWGGVVNGGKLAILIHMFLMAYGGWLLGRVLRLHAAGRVLLALLLAGCGGFVAAIGEGHYQIGLSQAYIPWIYAGLIGTLFLPRRWPMAVLAVTTMLMVFAGSFWYVLPTAIMCVLLSVLGIFDWTHLLHPVLVRRSLFRLLTVITLMVLLCAIRLLPQLNAARYFSHPQELLTDYYPLPSVLQVYFEPTAGSVGQSYWLRYAYVFPGTSALIIIALFVIVAGAGRPRSSTLVIVVASCLCIGFFTWWAMGATPVFIFLYTNFGWLGNWRRMGRLAAAASPLIAMLIAMLFDSLVTRLLAQRRQQLPFVVGSDALGLTLRLPTIIGQVVLLVLFGIGSFACLDVLNNWQRVASLIPVDPFNGRFRGITDTRLAYPTQFLSFDTRDISTSIEMYDTLSRSLVGNPEIFTIGQPNSIDTVRLLNQLAEFAAGSNQVLLSTRASMGYEPVSDAPSDGVTIAWRHPQALSYAFVVSRRTLTELPGKLQRSETQVIDTYEHHIEAVSVHVAQHQPNDVLIIFETAYPGWTVTVNDTPAPIESFGGRIGVVLPSTTGPTQVEFSYRPTILYLGAVISAIGVLGFLIFVFRLDVGLRKWLHGPEVIVGKAWAVIINVAKREL